MKTLSRPLIAFNIAAALIINSGGLPQSRSIKPETIKIGLLIQDSNSVAALKGAGIAIGEVNAEGGIGGRSIELLTRSLEGPWGTGSTQAVNLIFDEKVWALLCSHDGRNAHLVEQVATKSRVVLLSAWSADPTLSKAFVPWFFNSIPNDDQQAAVLADQLCRAELRGRYAVISDESYDSRLALKSFMLKVREKMYSEPFQIKWDSLGNNPETIRDIIQKKNYEAIVLFCQPKITAGISSMCIRENLNLKIFAPLSAINENELSENEISDLDRMLIVPSTGWDQAEFSRFSEKYFKVYGRYPGYVAASAYDAMKTLIRAISEAGSPEREKIQKSMAGLKLKGVTGTICFDNRGNRLDKISLWNIKKGVPAGLYKSGKIYQSPSTGSQKSRTEQAVFGN